MYRAAIFAALALLMAGPAMADATCSKAPAEKYKSKAALEAQLTAEGLSVRQIKLEGGCYEVYAVDKDKKQVNIAYNAETLEKVSDPEAGED